VWYFSLQQARGACAVVSGEAAGAATGVLGRRTRRRGESDAPQRRRTCNGVPPAGITCVCVRVCRCRRPPATTSRPAAHHPAALRRMRKRPRGIVTYA